MENFSDSIAVMYWPPFSGQRLSVNTIIDPGVFLMDSPWNLETHPYREKVEITKKNSSKHVHCAYIMPKSSKSIWDFNHQTGITPAERSTQELLAAAACRPGGSGDPGDRR